MRSICKRNIWFWIFPFKWFIGWIRAFQVSCNKNVCFVFFFSSMNLEFVNYSIKASINIREVNYFRINYIHFATQNIYLQYDSVGDFESENYIFISLKLINNESRRLNKFLNGIDIERWNFDPNLQSFCLWKKKNYLLE